MPHFITIPLLSFPNLSHSFDLTFFLLLLHTEKATADMVYMYTTDQRKNTSSVLWTVKNLLYNYTTQMKCTVF
jgi:hypothetical protein